MPAEEQQHPDHGISIALGGLAGGALIGFAEGFRQLYGASMGAFVAAAAIGCIAQLTPKRKHLLAAFGIACAAGMGGPHVYKAAKHTVDMIRNPPVLPQLTPGSPSFF